MPSSLMRTSTVCLVSGQCHQCAEPRLGETLEALDFFLSLDRSAQGWSIGKFGTEPCREWMRNCPPGAMLVSAVWQAGQQGRCEIRFAVARIGEALVPETEPAIGFGQMVRLAQARDTQYWTDR